MNLTKNARAYLPVVTTVVAAVAIGMAASLRPVDAKGLQSAPIERLVSVTIAPPGARQISKAHWGVYALAQYDYSPSGKMTITKRNDLILEEDMALNSGANFTRIKLKSGEYEIHIQPDKSRPIVKRFIVNNLSIATLPLAFDVAPIEDDAERKKTEYVRLGPSLADLEARIAALEKR